MLRSVVSVAVLMVLVGAAAPGQEVSLPAAPAVGEVTDFCFYIWTDTHFTADPIHGGVHDFAVDLMNGLPGTEGPPAFGAIPPAAFVLHAGDITNHGDPDQWKNEVNGTDDDFMTCISRLFLPVFEVRGNHDLDADQVYVRDRMIERHGDIHYAFEYGGVHFIGLDVTKRAPETGDEQLQWLLYELERVGPEVPVVVWQHLPVTGDMTWYPLYEVLNDYNVILLVYGHTHHYGHLVWNFGGIDLWDGGHNRFCIDMGSPSVLSVVKFEGSRMRALPYLTCEQRWDTAHFLDKMIAGRGTPTPTPTGPTRTPTLTPTPTVTRTPTVTYTQTFTVTPSATPIVADDFLLAFAGERVEPADLVSPYAQGRYQAISVPDGEQVHRVEFRMSSGTHTQVTAVFRVYLVGGVPGDGRSPEGRILLQESPPVAVGPSLDYYGFTLDPPLGRGRYYACVEVTAVDGDGTGWALERWTGEYDDTWDRGASGSFVLRADRDYALRAWLTAPSMTPSPTPVPAQHGAVSLY